MVPPVSTGSVAFLVAIRARGLRAEDDTDLTAQARRYAPSLIPIVLGYSIAHYFSLLVFEGQSFLELLSDPFGSGRDLFGTAGNTVDFTVVTAAPIAYVPVAALVIGDVMGVVLAHDPLGRASGR